MRSSHLLSQHPLFEVKIEIKAHLRMGFVLTLSIGYANIFVQGAAPIGERNGSMGQLAVKSLLLLTVLFIFIASYKLRPKLAPLPHFHYTQFSVLLSGRGCASAEKARNERLTGWALGISNADGNGDVQTSAPGSGLAVGELATSRRCRRRSRRVAASRIQEEAVPEPGSGSAAYSDVGFATMTDPGLCRRSRGSD